MDERWVLRGAAVACLLTNATFAGAQEALSFRTLAIPAPTLGTCMPLPAVPARAGMPARRGSRLVMMSRVPGRNRELMVSVNAQGRPIGYSERTFQSTGTLASLGDAILAGFTPEGTVRGIHLRTSTSSSDTALAHLRPDSASLRRMREGLRHGSTRQPLDSVEQRQARVLAAWLLKRCPA